METLVAVTVGGLVSIVATVTIDLVRGQRELRYRWDAPGLDALVAFVDATNRAVGVLYDEGRSRGEKLDGHELVAERDRLARTATDNVRVTHTRALLLLHPLKDPLKSCLDAVLALKGIADVGFLPGAPEWRAAQSAILDSVTELQTSATDVLKIHSNL